MADYMSKIFGASPVKPMQDHMMRATESVARLVEFIEAVVADDWVRASELQQTISNVEGDADNQKKSLRLNLPNSLFMPVARQDLIELLRTQDGIANRAKDVAGLMTGRRMQIPPQLHEGMLGFVRRCHDAAMQALRTVDELDELFETGFGGAEAKLVRSMIDEIGAIEADTDRLQKELRAVLFSIERDLFPVDVMFLYQIIDWIGDLADESERVGSRLHLILAN